MDILYISDGLLLYRATMKILILKTLCEISVLGSNSPWVCYFSAYLVKKALATILFWTVSSKTFVWQKTMEERDGVSLWKESKFSS